MNYIWIVFFIIVSISLSCLFMILELENVWMRIAGYIFMSLISYIFMSLISYILMVRGG